MRVKANNDLGCSAFTFSMQLNLEFAIKFWVLQFSDSCLQKGGKRLSIPEPIHDYVFFPQTYLQENAIQPTVNWSLGPSHANPFPKNNSNVLQWLGTLQSSNSGKSLRESVWLKIFWCKKWLIKQKKTHVFQKNDKNQCFFLNKHVFLN